jgi:hypothetical protein
MAETDWSDVEPRVAALAEATGAAEVFGASSHGWRLEAPSTEGDLAELELQRGVVLPAEYRSFLLHVSRGGAGPAYGLFPLRRTEGRWVWEGDGASFNERDLARPFAHVGAFNPADGRHDMLRHDGAHPAGLLYLCDLGCALREALVVSGPSRGQMWADDTADEEGYRPLPNPDGSRMTFADWYYAWLSESERTVAQGRADR